MSQEQINIADMQCRVFRMAQKKWDMPAAQCAVLFQKYKIMDFISECYDILHLNSYQCALDDIEELLHNRGVTI